MNSRDTGNCKKARKHKNTPHPNRITVYAQSRSHPWQRMPGSLGPFSGARRPCSGSVRLNTMVRYVTSSHQRLMSPTQQQARNRVVEPEESPLNAGDETRTSSNTTRSRGETVITLCRLSLHAALASHPTVRRVPGFETGRPALRPVKRIHTSRWLWPGRTATYKFTLRCQTLRVHTEVFRSH